MAEVKLTKDNFKQVVLEGDKPVLVDFWATWCGPCRMLAPELEALAEKYGDKIVVAKANVDEEPELAAAHKIESIPTLILYSKGSPQKMALGYKDLAALEEWLELK